MSYHNVVELYCEVTDRIDRIAKDAEVGDPRTKYVSYRAQGFEEPTSLERSSLRLTVERSRAKLSDVDTYLNRGFVERAHKLIREVETDLFWY